MAPLPAFVLKDLAGDCHAVELLPLADHLESVINANEDLPGRSVSVALQSDKLQINSDTYGISSEVTIGTDSAISDLGFSGTESDNGKDVVGKFVVNGADETATGSGRLLIGDSENATLRT